MLSSISMTSLFCSGLFRSTPPPKRLSTFDDQIVDPEIAVESEMRNALKVEGTKAYTSWYIELWASCQISKIAGAHAPGMPGTFSPPLRVSGSDMHHSTCVTHVPWCMPGSLTRGFLWIRRRGKTFPAFPAHAQAAIYVSGKRPIYRTVSDIRRFLCHYNFPSTFQLPYWSQKRS